MVADRFGHRCGRNRIGRLGVLMAIGENATVGIGPPTCMGYAGRSRTARSGFRGCWVVNHVFGVGMVWCRFNCWFRDVGNTVDRRSFGIAVGIGSCAGIRRRMRTQRDGRVVLGRHPPTITRSVACFDGVAFGHGGECGGVYNGEFVSPDIYGFLGSTVGV